MVAAVANPPVGDDVHVELLGPLLAADGAGLQVGGLDDLGAVGGADDAGALLGLPECHLQPALDDVLLRGGEVAQRRGRARLHGDQVQGLGDRDVNDPSRSFNMPTSAFTIKNLLRHYDAKQ